MSSSRSTSYCNFTFSDGRRCRTPRQPGDPLFCSDHARRRDRINTADQLGREFTHFFSGRYLSACDLNTALGRLFAATVRGHVPAKTTRTLAYLAQVMVQCIHLTEHEHAESFSPDSWRREVRASVNSNSAHLSPAPPAAPPLSPAFVEAGLQPSPAVSSQPATAVPLNAPVEDCPKSANLKSQLKQLLITELTKPAAPCPVPSLVGQDTNDPPDPAEEMDEEEETDEDYEDQLSGAPCNPVARRRSWRERV